MEEGWVDTKFSTMILGWISIQAGDYEEAVSRFSDAAQSPSTPVKITSLAWLSAAHLALGNIDAALEHSAQALTFDETPIYPPQEIPWWRYQAFVGALREAPLQMDAEAWRALDRAREIMMAGIDSIGDEGLRRNYLNKIRINRDITLEWTRRAAERGASLAPILERETSPAALQEQFNRLVEIGSRLTARRDAANLPTFILNEFEELSGAERAFIVLGEAADGFAWVDSLGISRGRGNGR